MSIEPLIESLTVTIKSVAPEILPLFEIYANEARFGRLWLQPELNNLSKTDKILEIGAGSMLLACQLCNEGYDVTALEPIGSGFSHFGRLQELVLMHAEKLGISPAIINGKGEDISDRERYSFIYSINVMEHVDSPETVLRRTFEALKQAGAYRFVCPNYTFPYETHLGIPIIWNKAFTWKLFKNRIQAITKIDDPLGLWQSLNWISVHRIKKFCSGQLAVKPAFDTHIIHTYLNRAFADSLFQQRHNKIILGIVNFLSKTRLLQCLHLIPAAIMPIMDCRIVKH